MDSETDFDNSEISLGTEQNDSKDGTAVIDNSVPPSAWITKFLSDSTFNSLIVKPMAPTGLPDNAMMDIVAGKV